MSPLGEGVFELRFDFGPGYRVYFGIDQEEIVPLGGGDKDSQGADITKAKSRWEDYNA
jgi:putative addiction module killer protein